MILFPSIINSVRRNQVRVSFALDFAKCQMRRASEKSYHAVFDVDGKVFCQYAALVVLPPGRAERLRFCGMHPTSVMIAARKAFCEYLEAATLWGLGLSEEVSRSGWACFSTAVEAKSRAYRELIERDSFIMHFLCPSLRTEPLPRFSGFEKFPIVKLQSVDSELHVVFCGNFIEEENKWILGGGCSSDMESAAQAALFEVLMQRKDWTTAALISAEIQPKRHALLPHWSCQTDLQVQKSIDAMLNGRGIETISYRVDPAHVEQISSRTFSPQHIVVGTRHPDLCPLTFGALWKASENQIRRILIRRYLEVPRWMTHPML